MKQSFKQAGYKYISYLKNCHAHILLNVYTGKTERFFANKNHASWGLTFKNTHLEFASTEILN